MTRNAITKTPIFIFAILCITKQFLTDAAMTCGEGTFLSNDTESCECDTRNITCSTLTNNVAWQFDTSSVYIGGLFDKTGFYWGEEIFNMTIDMLNDHNDGWHDDILSDGTEIKSLVVNAACDPKVAVPAYWKLQTEWGNPLHGIIGCRCSGASISVSRIAGLENVPVVSMSSTSARLSRVDEFPSFFRLVGPDDYRGQVGALVSLLTHLGWNRISVINTETDFTKDLAFEFGNLWKGDIAYFHTVRIDSDGAVDAGSLDLALDGVPTENPRLNSRVIVLLAHHQHAFPILQRARERNFQPDTIWVGTHSWTDRFFGDSTQWMPDIPGYIGIAQYRNRNSEYQDFLQRIQAKQRQLRPLTPVMEFLPDYAAETMVDSILSLAKALSSLQPKDRAETGHIVNALKNITFSGVSGPVSFTAEGDRANPQYMVMNFPTNTATEWVNVGVAGITPDTVDIDIRAICWASVGCNQATAPTDTYPVPPNAVPLWGTLLIVVISILFIIIALKYWRSRQKKTRLKANIDEMQKKINAMQNIDNELYDLDQQVEKAKRKQASLLLKRADLQEIPSTWTEVEDALVEVNPHDEEYWDIHDKLRESMGTAWISKLWRVQNMSLWTYYSFHKDRLTRNGINHNERLVWHGTSSLDPSIIYNDQQDGFMMQFSNKGLWGRGIYFADESVYSDKYSYKPPTSDMPLTAGRCEGEEDEREMFLAKLLVGNMIFIDRDESPEKASECRKLTVPPTDASTGLKYNTVRGETSGSQVWIVYENGRAYPDYVVRYYKGRRDINRTLYKTRNEATRSKKRKQKSSSPKSSPKSSSHKSYTPKSDPTVDVEQGLSS
mmetsp:Transcript_28279/g.41030  ORF Transcript_28279/g.41030 Transcript_28279/m.41030 type:complete len:836 (+) Transcript_28279:124-2631(+)